jgi:hypothetical protein
MKNTIGIMAAIVALAATIGGAQRQSDPDKMQAGGTLPAGWSARLDNGSTKPDGVKITPMGGGLHFQSGPAGIYYKPGDRKSGSYTVSATFTQLEPAAHPEAYGLFIGGSALDGADQRYTYFLVRQDGKFLVKKRTGATSPTVTSWTENPAVKKADASGKMTNVLAVNVDKDKVHFLVNGAEVSALPTSDIDTNGIVGLRVNHNLNVHVDGFSVK